MHDTIIMVLLYTWTINIIEVIEIYSIDTRESTQLLMIPTYFIQLISSNGIL